MPLSAEQVYDELNGAEVKEILLQRVKDLLDTVPDFQRHLTLPRVRMQLNIHLDIFGRRNPALDLLNDFTISTRGVDESKIELAKELVAEDTLSADTGIPVPGTPFDGAGAPPDEIRELHQIPTMEPVRDRVTGITQQRPVQPPPVETAPVPKPATPQGRPWAAFHTLERGGPVVRGYSDYLPGHEPIGKEAPAGEREIGIQEDFRNLSRLPEKP